jgi:hypothetical protein
LHSIVVCTRAVKTRLAEGALTITNLGQTPVRLRRVVAIALDLSPILRQAVSRNSIGELCLNCLSHPRGAGSRPLGNMRASAKTVTGTGTRESRSIPVYRTRSSFQEEI